jgi:hypothetical protein
VVCQAVAIGDFLHIEWSAQKLIFMVHPHPPEADFRTFRLRTTDAPPLSDPLPRWGEGTNRWGILAAISRFL